MALFRSVNMNFWTDTKVSDDYTPEDKYFMLYALTNSYTNLIGCYEISIKQMANDLGYSKDTIESLLKRFKEVHKTIDYDFETKELLVKNWYKYNWNASPKLDAPLKENLLKVKSSKFYKYLAEIYNNRETIDDTLYIPYKYPIYTTNTITNTITNSNTINNNININNIIDYLNLKTNKHFKYTASNIGKIRARIKEGFTEEDFKQVIDKKCLEWLNDKKMNTYLRPETLFGSKFESYLQQDSKEITLNDLSLEDIQKMKEVEYEKDRVCRADEDIDYGLF